jgi:phage gp36-like protein
MIAADVAVAIAAVLVLFVLSARKLQPRLMPNPLILELHASAPETASGTGLAIDLADRSLIQLTLEVTAFAGTSPTLSVVIENSLTGLDWSVVAQFAPLAAIATKTLVVPESMRFMRARWAIGGSVSPSVTFLLTGTANQLYALPSDIVRYGLPASALEGIPAAVLADFCLAASEEASGYLASAYTLPLANWGTDLRKHVARMVAYDVMSWRGYDPDSGKDDLLSKNRDMAIEWLNRVANGKLRPIGVEDATPLIAEEEIYIDSAPSRGWSR